MPVCCLPLLHAGDAPSAACLCSVAGVEGAGPAHPTALEGLPKTSGFCGVFGGHIWRSEWRSPKAGAGMGDSGDVLNLRSCVFLLDVRHSDRGYVFMKVFLGPVSVFSVSRITAWLSLGLRADHPCPASAVRPPRNPLESCGGDPDPVVFLGDGSGFGARLSPGSGGPEAPTAGPVTPAAISGRFQPLPEAMKEKEVHPQHVKVWLAEAAPQVPSQLPRCSLGAPPSPTSCLAGESLGGAAFPGCL